MRQWNACYNRYKIHGHTNTLGILTKGPTQIVSTGAQITGAGGKLYAVSDSPVSAVQRIHAHAMHSDAPPRIEVASTEDRTEHAELSNGLIALVHDDAAKLTEVRGVLHRLGEEVSGVLVSRHVGHLELERLDHVAHVEVATLDVLHLVVVLRVVGDITSALAVSREVRRPILSGV